MPPLIIPRQKIKFDNINIFTDFSPSRQGSSNSSKMLYVGVEALDGKPLVLDKNPTDVVGIVFALAGAILSAWITILARQLNTVNFCVQLIWGSVGGLIISILALLSNNSLQG